MTLYRQTAVPLIYKQLQTIAIEVIFKFRLIIQIRAHSYWYADDVLYEHTQTLCVGMLRLISSRTSLPAESGRDLYQSAASGVHGRVLTYTIKSACKLFIVSMIPATFASFVT